MSEIPLQGRRIVGLEQRRSSSRLESWWHLGTGRNFLSLPKGRCTEAQRSSESYSASMASFLSNIPLPSYSFFGGLALELPCLSLLELGRPLAWCGGTSWSISSVEVGGRGLTHRWAVCGRHVPLSDPSACKITARTDTTLCLSFLCISSQMTELWKM